MCDKRRRSALPAAVCQGRADTVRFAFESQSLFGERAEACCSIRTEQPTHCTSQTKDKICGLSPACTSGVCVHIYRAAA